MEKRLYPRVIRQFSAIIENSQGVRLNVLAIEASSKGLAVKCSTYQRDLITPGGSFICNGKPVELNVWLELPFDDGHAENIGARCYVSFSRRISNSQCEIGMRYAQLDQDGYHTLIKFIESATA